MSLISFSATRSRLAAWLGLLAIALLFIAPAIAKSLALTHGGNGMMMHHATHSGGSMMMHHPGHDSHSEMIPTAADHSPLAMKMDPASLYHPMSMMDDSACGYCVLLVHLALGLTAVPLLWRVRRATAPPESPLPLPVITRITLPFFHPRAPPLLYVSQ